MDKQFTLTEERLNEIGKELEYLKTVREKEVAEQIKEARSFGDLSENSEYDEAKNEQGKLYSRIAELENVVANCVIINEDAITTQHVAMGTKITILEKGEKEPDEYAIVGAQEANPGMGRISDESPLGKALYGHAVGEKIFVETPSGTTEYKIISIERN